MIMRILLLLLLLFEEKKKERTLRHRKDAKGQLFQKVALHGGGRGEGKEEARRWQLPPASVRPSHYPLTSRKKKGAFQTRCCFARILTLTFVTDQQLEKKVKAPSLRVRRPRFSLVAVFVVVLCCGFIVHRRNHVFNRLVVLGYTTLVKRKAQTRKKRRDEKASPIRVGIVATSAKKKKKT